MKKTNILLILLLLGGLCFAANNSTGFRIEPYILEVTGDSATVAFFLHDPLPASVNVYAGPEKQTFDSTQKRTSHFVKITGLQPGLVYRYEVICGAGDRLVRTPPDDQSYRIKTAGLPGEYFTFTVYGDPRPGDTLTDRYHRAVIDRVLVQEPAFTLILGDMVDDGTDDTLWEDFFRVEAPLLRRAAIYPVLGDNDVAGGKGTYGDYFPLLHKGYYRFQWGGVHFFGLHTWDTMGSQDSSEFNADSPQYKWFIREISRPEVRQASFRVVFMHDPVYICRGKASETLRNTWMPLFQKYKVDAVFASWHIYERSVDKGVTYIITGGAGAELISMNKNPAFPSQVDASQYHFCRVDVSAGAMDIRAIATDGTVLDTITLVPRSYDEEEEKQVEKAARRLSEEILIGKIKPEIPEIPLYLFSYDCRYCRKLLRHDLPSLAKKNEVALRVSYYDLSKQGAYDLFLNVGAEFGRQDADIPAIFIGNTTIGGEAEIKDRLPRQIERFLKNPQQFIKNTVEPFKRDYDTSSIGDEVFSTLTLSIVIGAGLLDGINPCAFTTIIFLISYLSLVGASRRRMLYTGGVFTAAVFFTYFIIGVAFFKFAGVLLKNPGISIIVNVLLLVFVLILGILSLIDFVKCLKGNAADMTLQLPGFLKKGIHGKIRHFARNKRTMMGASFVLGIVIAGMELTCTGQVYIPIVTMISEPQHRVMAIFYLFLYNVAFIIPLAVVFLLVFFGLTSEKLAAFFKKHLAGVKLGFAILFALMAVMIVYNLRWL